MRNLNLADSQVEAMLSGPSILRGMCCFLLGQLNPPLATRKRHVEMLTEVLMSDPDEAVRSEAACAIGHMGAAIDPNLLLPRKGDSRAFARSKRWALKRIRE